MPVDAMTAQEITIHTEDGVALAARVVQPQATGSWGAVVIHGIGHSHREPLIGAVCEMLARRGLLAVGVDMRWHDAYQPGVVRTSRFEDTIYDIRAAVDWLEARGVRRVVLLGKSLGSLRCAYYVTETRDSRVAGVVFLEPARVDMSFHRTLRASWGDEADRALAWAEALVSQGKGDTVGEVPGHHGYRILSTAAAFLSYNAASAQTTYAHVPEIRCPLLILEGAEAAKVRDHGFNPDRRALLQAASNSPVKELIVIDGADHSFTGCWDPLERALGGWLQRVCDFEEQQ